MAKLYFRYGAMNCGKTTALIQAAYNYEERGMRVLVIKPKIDTKGNDVLVSRIGAERSADLVADDKADLFSYIKHESELSPLDCVLCDESQFFTPAQIDELFEAAVRLGVPVLCYGLRTDFLMHGFPGSVRLLEIAHSIEELKTICHCGKKAMINARMVDGEYVFEGSQVVIDNQSNVEYRSLCPECYFNIRDERYGRVQNERLDIEE